MEERPMPYSIEQELKLIKLDLNRRNNYFLYSSINFKKNDAYLFLPGFIIIYKT